jgi:hypothetical protein
MLFSNFLGLFPYTFTRTRHLIVTVTLALPLWVIFIIFGWINNTNHIFEQGTSTVLIPFIVLWHAAWKLEYLNRSGRPFLDNGSVTRFPVSLSGWQLNTFTRQRIHRQMFPAQQRCLFHYYGYTEPLDKVFSTESAKDHLKEMQTQIGTDSHVEAGSNTSTVTLRVIGGDKKWSLESERVKYGHKSNETRTWQWLHWQGSAAIVNNIPVLLSERMPHIKKPATVWQ